jgi:hypothetical protein
VAPLRLYCSGTPLDPRIHVVMATARLPRLDHCVGLMWLLNVEDIVYLVTGPRLSPYDCHYKSASGGWPCQRRKRALVVIPLWLRLVRAPLIMPYALWLARREGKRELAAFALRGCARAGISGRLAPRPLARL